MAAESVDLEERPDGSRPIAVGWMCLVVAVFFIARSFASGPTGHQLTMLRLESEIGGAGSAAAEIAQASAIKFFMQIGAGAFFSLFLVFWSFGYIVKVISFLPGRPELKGNVTE